MAAKKKAAKSKRPPRSFYITFNPTTGKKAGDFTLKSTATEEASRTGLEVAGPYILAERVGQR